MFEVEGIDLEYPQIGKEPKIGYEDVAKEYTMISGKIRKIFQGRRFKANFTYAFLTSEQRGQLLDLINSQKTKGFLTVKIKTAFGEFNGDAFLTIDGTQTRFSYSKILNDYVWTNWSVSILAVGLEK